ncbi:MAG: UDP-3-O-(3-hydroxymyristoyl)glucosamine N-acyltransferase [Thermodesulfobacteriota bacterium]
MEEQQPVLTLAQCAEMVGGELRGGEGDALVRGVNDLGLATASELSFAAGAGRREEVLASAAAAVIVPSDMAEIDRPVIRVANPYLAVTLVHGHFLRRPFTPAGIHPSAVIGYDCRIPEEVSIGAGVVIGDGCRCGRRVTVRAGTVLGEDVELGDDVLIHANVTLYPGTRIGSRVIIHSGAVIGSDGYGYATDGRGRHHKRPHVGRVVIEDDVEIGANTTVDRATFGETRIGRGSKIDNLVQIGHNVSLGENDLIVAQCGISGSTRLGDNVVMGGNAGVAGHLVIGNRVMIAAKSGVHGDIGDGQVYGGLPAIPRDKWLRVSAITGRLPDIHKEFKKLCKEVERLRAEIERLQGTEHQS